MPEKSFNRAARWTGFGLAIVGTILIAVVTNREGYKKREFRDVTVRNVHMYGDPGEGEN